MPENTLLGETQAGETQITWALAGRYLGADIWAVTQQAVIPVLPILVHFVGKTKNWQCEQVEGKAGTLAVLLGRLD